MLPEARQGLVGLMKRRPTAIGAALVLTGLAVVNGGLILRQVSEMVAVSALIAAGVPLILASLGPASGR